MSKELLEKMLGANGKLEIIANDDMSVDLKVSGTYQGVSGGLFINLPAEALVDQGIDALEKVIPGDQTTMAGQLKAAFSVWAKAQIATQQAAAVAAASK